MDSSRQGNARASLPVPSGNVLRLRPLPDRAGWRAVGEITSATCPAWEQTLEQLTRRNELVCHLEMSAVTFVDVAGASALAVAAQRLPAGRRIVVERPPSALRCLLEMFWPDLSVIEVVAR
ncbi:STAS domain-containing protein [Streptomyces sp. ADMS]|uniref:STAS domain-containing protein n=1 Tax=Streptomyces sp. ADMS TaxID=3071415 RepID=UPI00296E3F58|nr:STAS domain-containing protein [Streptomyces sp. ADMS]MDW4903883.1 STAS domain-containing protein [Streptomyces sp. ADMS]